MTAGMKPFGRRIMVFVVLVVAAVTVLMVKDWVAEKGAEAPSVALAESSVSEARLNGLEGVGMEGGEYNLNDHSIKFILMNKSNSTIYYGNQVLLEKYVNPQWFEIPYSGEIGFLAILNRLEPNESLKISVPVEMWTEVSAGEYRVVMEVSNQERMKELYPLSCNFTIE